MLQNLPVEVVQQIIGYLPTASAIINLALTNRKIHTIIAANDYAIFRAFVQGSFPSIKTPLFWKDVARTLTSRSRAWDRRAFIARECFPPSDSVDASEDVTGGWTIGYRPVIDSYETWLGGSWSSRKEVLAWGAAGRLYVRTTKDGSASWNTFRIPHDHRQELDILDVRLLLPHQRENQDEDSIMLRRANHEVIQVETTSKRDSFRQKTRYLPPFGDISCLDVSRGENPVLVICDNRSLNLYPVHSSERRARPMHTALVQEHPSNLRDRWRCVKFLSDTTVAVGTQFLQGRERALIYLYDISPSGLSESPLTESMSLCEAKHPLPGRHGANVIIPLDDVHIGSHRTGQIFLSGWTDGVARLHDTRAPGETVAEYVDPVDDGQILSLLAIGHERFLAGSHQNGCLKTFDFRMSGARAYSYLDARPPRPRPPNTNSNTSAKQLQRDINIFLTPTINHRERLWRPLPRHPSHRSQRYRGSVYSLSSPSPSSPTVYAGIENHVLQLDFVSTDDYRSHVPGRVDPSLGLEDRSSNQNYVFNFSCYERPRVGRESTDPVLLRKQLNLTGGRRDSIGQRALGDHNGGFGQKEDGWDERWRLDTYRGRRFSDRMLDRG